MGQATDPVKLKKPLLYDLEEDPGEQDDVAAQHPEIVARLSEKATSFAAGITPVMKLPPATRSFVSGITTHAPKDPEKLPK
jgi:hypothetical protein